MLSFSVTSLASNGTAEKEKTVKVAVIGMPTGAELFAQTVLAKVEALGFHYVESVVSEETVLAFKPNTVKELDYAAVIREDDLPPDILKRQDNFKNIYTKNYKYNSTGKKQKPFRSARDSL